MEEYKIEVIGCLLSMASVEFTKKKGDKLFRKEVKYEVILSIWPSSPSHLSKPRNIRTTKFATLRARNDKVNSAKKLRNEKEIEEEMFSSLGEIHRINQVEHVFCIDYD